MHATRAWAGGFCAGLTAAAAAWLAGGGGTRAADEPKPAVAAAAKAELPPVPPALETLNRTNLKTYGGARARELAGVPAVLIVWGDDLILRRGDKRVSATVVPPEYHAQKCVAHITLGLFGALAHDAGKPLGEAAVKALSDYREQIVAAGPAVEKYGYDPDTLARQRRLLARSLAFLDQVLAGKQVSADDLTRYCRASRADVAANGAAAARAQVAGLHRQVTAWKAEMTPDEWAGLAVIVIGRQTPRAENAWVQYFARLFGEPGECRRIVYAEGASSEEQALDLLGTLRLDGKLSVAVFDDRYRMYRDFLADGARVALDDLFAGR